LIVYSFEDYSAASFIFLPAASIFQLFSRDSPILLFESTAASTLAAAVYSLTHFCFYCFGSVFYFVVSFFFTETSTKVATRANPKNAFFMFCILVIYIDCWINLHILY
jgi:bacteriorhodopsin